MSTKHDCVLLFSGGLDSFCAYHYLNKPTTVYFDLRTRYSQKEKKHVLSIIPDTKIDTSLNLGSREQGDKAYVPFRNLLLAAQAVHYADTVYIAGVADDQVSDKNEPIFQQMSIILSRLEGRDIQVLSPFWRMTKAEVVGWFLTHVTNDPSQLLNCISCYSPEDTHYCGRCPSCFRKWNALRDNNIDIDFYNHDLLEEYYARAKAGQYIPERNASIIQQVDSYRSRH